MFKWARHVKALVIYWGVSRATLAIVARILRPWFLLCEVQTRVNSTMQDMPLMPEGIEVKQASKTELLRATLEMPGVLSSEFVESALNRGEICVAAFCNGSIVAFQWASFAETPMRDRLLVRFKSEYRYGHNGYTRLEYRGRRIAQQVMRYCDELCLKRGYTHTIVWVECANYASRMNLARLGNHCVGYFGYLQLFGRYYIFRTPGTKACGFEVIAIPSPS